MLGLLLDRSGYLRDLREERSEESDGRIENLMELVSAARQYEAGEADPSLASFVDRLALLSDVDKPEGSQAAQALLMTMHSAKGLEFPVVVIAGLEEGLFPHSRAQGRRSRTRGGAPALLRRHHRARRRELYLTSAMRRRVFGEYQNTEPSRFLDEIPPGPAAARGVARRSHAGAGPELGLRGHALQPRATAAARAAYAPEDEDQSGRGGLRAGSRVRHAMFGVGTVQSVEELDDDMKVVVTFTTVGRKTLRAKYAKLQPA